VNTLGKQAVGATAIKETFDGLDMIVLSVDDASTLREQVSRPDVTVK
jgi:hypothetical protein